MPPQAGVAGIRRLRAQADRARRLAKMTLDVLAAANLLSYANDLEADARKLEEEPKNVV